MLYSATHISCNDETTRVSEDRRDLSNYHKQSVDHRPFVGLQKACISEEFYGGLLEVEEGDSGY